MAPSDAHIDDAAQPFHGLRRWDKDKTFPDQNKTLRYFYYDGCQRVELVKVWRPTTTDNYDLHHIWTADGWTAPSSRAAPSCT